MIICFEFELYLDYTYSCCYNIIDHDLYLHHCCCIVIKLQCHDPLYTDYRLETLFDLIYCHEIINWMYVKNSLLNLRGGEEDNIAPKLAYQPLQ